uniref:Ras association domain family member 10 n=1 Tax=Scophthalmus maximus TaxID=52904 RepID=A0A8D3BJ66_SCOMX
QNMGFSNLVHVQLKSLRQTQNHRPKISVWVCREEKLVLGLSKRTTCADVVQVLLEDQGAQRGLSAPQSYCVVEKWRGFERILPNTTKILRLWAAWGEEQKNVKFVLVKSDASLASRGARSAEARVVLSTQSPWVAKGSARSPIGGIAPEKQRRVVRKAFRKLERINEKRARVAHRDARSAEKMETLVHLVVSQDHTVRQQVQRISELDAEIESCEAKVHSDRIKRHGVNYVQDTYLVGAAAASSCDGDDPCPPETLVQLEEYARRCEEVVRLQEELWEREALVDIIPFARRAEADGTAANELQLEGERLKTQLDASLYIGLRLNTDLEAIRSDLELSQEICAARERETRDLLEELSILDTGEGAASGENCDHGTDDKTGMMSTLERKSAWVEQARGLSKAHSVNDDDSDTGLSSLHSQDSDCHPVWESLV